MLFKFFIVFLKQIYFKYYVLFFVQFWTQALKPEPVKQDTLKK